MSHWKMEPMMVRVMLCLCASIVLWGCDDSKSDEQVPAHAKSTLIKNARIVDGTGVAEITGAVRIAKDRIVAVGDLEVLPGDDVIDASGLLLVPGFVDSHSHHDDGMFDQREMLAAVSQGITTIVRGSDGAGFEADDGFMPLAQLNGRLRAQPVAVNVASYAPHGSIRQAVMGDDFARPATAEEVERMKALVAADMGAGALGLNTGLEYEPGIYAATEEVIELARVAADFGGRYASHMRDEDDQFFVALDELIRIGREAAIPVHVSHIKLADTQAWGQTQRVIGVLEAALRSGVRVSADIYPYLHWQSNLAILFPDRDFTNREAAVFTFERTTTPEDLILSDFAAQPDLAGKTIAQIADEMDADPIEVLMKLAQQSYAHLQATGSYGDSIIAKSMTEADVRALMSWQGTNICSDGGLSGGHPRGFGAFPRVLHRYIGDEGRLTVEQAIYKMTGLAAANVGIEQRGIIKVGAYADLVLVDLAQVQDRATFEDSILPASGIEKVWVNGQVVYTGGAPTGVHPGRVLSRADEG